MQKMIKTMSSFMMGAVTGMMFAPKEGEQLRKDIKNSASKVMKKVKKVKKEECKMIEGVTSEVKGKMKDIEKVIEE